MTEAASSAVARFWGGLLIAVGSLIAALCGACTLGLGMMSLAERNPGMLILVIPIGGVPTAVGALLAWWGSRLFWPRARPAAVDAPGDPSDGAG